jgi:PAS domain S-box-containing protein
MTAKPSYEELEKRVQELEKIESKYKYSKQALQENDSLFKMLYEKAPLGYQSLDENGHFIVVNQTWLDTLGYAREDVIGKSFANFLHPDWRNHFKENFPRFKSIGEILGVEFEMVKKNGDLILVSFTGKISRDETGDFQQTHCIFQDITERKKSDEITARHHEELNEINRIGRIAGATLELEQVLRCILQNVTEYLNSSVGMIFLADPVKKNITWGASLGLSEQFVNDFKETPIRIGEGLTGTIVQTGKPIFIQENSSNDPRIVRPVVVKENLNSFLGVPIFAEDKVVGVMNILTRPPVKLEERDKHFCSAVGSQVGLAIINAKKYSELKKAEESLRRNEKDLRESQRIAHVGSWRLDVATNEVVWTEEPGYHRAQAGGNLSRDGAGDLADSQRAGRPAGVHPARPRCIEDTDRGRCRGPAPARGRGFSVFRPGRFLQGFSADRKHALERGKDGGVCRDKDGNVRLECTCGLVISGKTDPSNPLFTKGGSCWTNDSFPLLDLPSDQDPRLHPRNNCIHQGYASVALIPVFGPVSVMASAPWPRCRFGPATGLWG